MSRRPVLEALEGDEWVPITYKECQLPNWQRKDLEAGYWPQVKVSGVYRAVRRVDWAIRNPALAGIASQGKNESISVDQGQPSQG